MRDNISGCHYVNLGTLTISGATTSTSGYLDTRGFDAASIVVVNGTITNAGTAAGFTVTLQESADTTGAAAATATETVNGNTVTVTNDAADDVVAGKMGYLGNKRYIGVTATGTLGTSAVITLLGALSLPSVGPASTSGTVVARTLSFKAGRYCGPSSNLGGNHARKDHEGRRLSMLSRGAYRGSLSIR